MPVMLREALRLVYEVFMVTPPNNTGAGLRLLLGVILGNALLLLEAELEAVWVSEHLWNALRS